MKTISRIALLIVSVIAPILCAQGAIPAGYYNSLNGKSGQALKSAASALAKKHTVLTYGSLWNYFPSTDCYPDNKSRVWDMYSDDYYYFNGTRAVSGMNKEHSLPKSWWGGTQVDAYTDINHLYPSDAEANTAKLHYPLGEVSSASFNNGVSKVGTPVSGQGGGSATVFEPDDRYKGDFARTYFYMATCYQDYTWKYTWMMSNTSWLTMNSWAIQMLLKWAREDPVSEKETLRNEAVYRIQNNRNPFIDIPDLCEYIFGNKAGQVFNIDGGEVTGQPELITPTQGTALSFGEIGLGKSLNYVVYIKGKNLTTDLRVQLYKDDYRMFSIPVTSIPRTTAMTDEGYPLTITYNPTEVGEHKAKLLILDGGLVGSVGIELSAECKDVPTLAPIVAREAINVSEGHYTASWDATSDEIDNYIITRTVYNNSNEIIDSEQFIADAEETTYEFNDLKEGETHTYIVQSSRLGYLSPESNVITISTSGIESVNTDKPLALLPIDGGVVVKCSEPLHNVCVFNGRGQLVKQIDEVMCDDVIYLPGGVYILSSADSSKHIKVVIR